jgi:hypothetical protein
VLGAAEPRLFKVAAVLTAILIFVLLAGGARLLFLSQPEPIAPASSTLKVEGIRGSMTGAEEELPTDLVDRPIFWLGRKPFEAAGEEVEVVRDTLPVGDDDLDNVRLVGVIGDGSNSSVIVTYQGKNHRLKLDDEIAGWTFAMFSPQGAMFENGGQRQPLELQHAKPTAPARARAVPKRLASGSSRDSANTEKTSSASAGKSAKKKPGKSRDSKDKKDKGSKGQGGKKKKSGKDKQQTGES